MANHISHASLPFPVKGCRYTIFIPYLDADGDPTDPTTPDTERSIDGAAYADCTEEVTTITGSNGSGYLTLTGDEMNGSLIGLAAKVASGPKATLASLYPRVLPILHSGTAQAGASGTITLASGATTVDDFYVGCIVRTTGGTGGGGGSGSLGNQARVITDYVGSTKVATISPNWETTPDNTTTYEVLHTEMCPNKHTDTVVTTGTVTNRVDANVDRWLNTTINGPASGRIDVTVGNMQANTFTASALATDAVTEIRSLVSGTSDSGTTTTMVDAARTEADTDYWKGAWILFTSGTISGQCRLITGFNAATDTITFAPATTAAVSTQTYEILPAGRIDVGQWLSTTPGGLQGGLMDSYVSGMAINTLTADALADDAVAEITAGVADGVWDEATNTHVSAGSFGQALNTVRANTAQAGAAGTITLDASASAVDDFYNNTIIFITGGTGVGQSRIISDYVGATKVATVNGNWGTNPDSTSVFVILPFGSVPGASAPTAAQVADAVWDELMDDHLVAGSFGQGTGVIRAQQASAGTTTTLTLDLNASATNDAYNGDFVSIVSGLGKGQTRIIADYAGPTRTITIGGKAWDITPDGTSIYTITPFADVAGLIWGAAMTEYADAGTFGQRLQVLDDGTAAAGAATTITLDGGASGSDDIYNNCLIFIVGGTGAYQVRRITDYVGSTKVATIDTAWVTNPNATSLYLILPDYNATTAAVIADAVWDEAISGHTAVGTFGQQLQAVRTGTAQAGASTTITLDASANATNDFYNNTIVFITGGTGTGQARLISDYVGSTKVATVSEAWITNPDNTSVFAILPFTEVASLTLADIFTYVVENSVTFEQVLRGLLAAMTGKSNGGGTTNINFRNNADSGNRISATVDANGNRTAVTLNLT